MGAPTKAVTAFKGNVNVFPGICAIRSKRRARIAPSRVVDGNKILWSDVFKRLLAKCGTATPKNPIGPQKAVIAPANKEVLPIIDMRAMLIFNPILLA